MDPYFIAVVTNNAPTKADQKDRPGVWIEVKPVWAPAVKNAIWARVLQPFATLGAGAVFVPEKDDEVLVLGGNSPGAEAIVLGSLYTEKRKPATFQQKKDELVSTVRGVVTPGGMEITLDDTKGKEAILVRGRGDPDGAIDKDLVSVMLAKKDGVLTVVAGEATITVKKKALTITVEEGDVTIVATKGAVSVESKGDTTVTASGNVTVEGKQIDIKGDSVNIA